MNAKQLKQSAEVKIKNIVDDLTKKTGLEILGVNVSKDKYTGFVSKQEERRVSIILE